MNTATRGWVVLLLVMAAVLPARADDAPPPLLASAPARTTFRDVIAERQAFHRYTLREEYLRVGQREEAWDTDALALLDDVAMEWSDESNGPPAAAVGPRRWTAEERDGASRTVLFIRRCNDPLLHYLNYRSAPPHLGYSANILLQSVEGLLTSPYSAYRKAEAVLGARRAFRKNGVAVDDARVVRLDALIREHVGAVLTDDELPTRWDVHVVRAVMPDDEEDNPELTFGALAERLEAMPTPRPWRVEAWLGMYHHERAWFIRGRDWAETVPRDAWPKFAAALQLAERHQRAAWNMRPTEPWMAVQLLNTARGLQNGQARQWFDRATALVPDYLPAYRQMLFTLRPRWSGSHAQMLALADHADTLGGFDTFCPDVRWLAVRDVMADLAEGSDAQTPPRDPHAPLRDALQAQRFAAFAAGRAADPRLGPAPDDYRTLEVIAHWLGRDYEAALTAAERLERGLDDDARWWFHAAAQRVLEESAVRRSPRVAALVDAAEAAERDRDLDAAKRLYITAMREVLRDNRPAVDELNRRSASAGFRIAFDAGDPVVLVTQADRPWQAVWRKLRGRWSVADAGLVTAHAAAPMRSVMMVPDQGFGSRVVVHARLRLDPVEPPEGDAPPRQGPTSAGVLMNGIDWHGALSGVSYAWSPTERELVVGSDFANIRERIPLPEVPDTGPAFELRVEQWGPHIRLTINGHVIAEPRRLAAVQPGEGLGVAVGGTLPGGTHALVVESLTVQRLADRPAWVPAD